MTEFEAKLLANLDELRQGQLRVHAELRAIRETIQQLPTFASAAFADGCRLWRDAVETVKARYPAEVFPEDGKTINAQAGTFAREVCEQITKLAEELECA